MLNKPQKYNEALNFIKNKVPTDSIDYELLESQADEVRIKSLFSANVENYRFLERAQRLMESFLSKEVEEVKSPSGKKSTALKVGSRADFVQQMRDFQIKEGMATSEDFKGNQNDIKDITKLSRLNLIFDTNIRQAFGFGSHIQSMHPTILETFPAARFVRLPGAKEKRQRHAKSENEVRLKVDRDWWANYQNSPDIGGFAVPWAPFGYNSYMDKIDVSRKEAVELGLIQENETVTNDKKESLTDRLRVDITPSNRELFKKLMNNLRSKIGDKVIPDETGIKVGNLKEIVLSKEQELNETLEKIDNQRDSVRKDLSALRKQWRSLKTEEKREQYQDFASKEKNMVLKMNKLESEKSLAGLSIVELPKNLQSSVKILNKGKLRAANQIRGVDAIQRVVHKDLGVTVRFAGRANRAFHRDKGDHGEIRSTSDNTPGVIAHEIMHQIEKRYLLDESLAYLKKRSAGESPISLNKLTGQSFYARNEVAFKDKFAERGHTHYTGKDYKGRATEMLTSGIERLLENPVKLLKDDEEFFDWIVNLVQKR